MAEKVQAHIHFEWPVHNMELCLQITGERVFTPEDMGKALTIMIYQAFEMDADYGDSNPH